MIGIELSRTAVQEFFAEQRLEPRVTGGAPPKGTSMGQILSIELRQDGKGVPLQLNYDKAIWSGLSWAAAEANAMVRMMALWPQ